MLKEKCKGMGFNMSSLKRYRSIYRECEGNCSCGCSDTEPVEHEQPVIIDIAPDEDLETIVDFEY